ncbi:tRNA adenosine deaminase-associated protein [Corynebacterium hindlerae]|uniref:tRNA adenosine deaminase-associated protein n=1 Tax=Corynebacterium hindlerae TaxID=699041 RepID=A0A7G5FI95_9CORY|nr:tRNA adenosine deaminase-associated protein [Corynebacterium hindlerae]QMV86336.1 tRNA adenosine deaminase-associated protein [Corynebacterium hindlerae]
MSTNEEPSFAVTVTQAAGVWKVAEYDDDFRDVSDAVTAVRRLRAEGPAFAMLCVEDDYFIIVRPTPGGVKLLISDATAALDDDFAASALDLINADPEDGEPYAEGDFDLLADLGLSEQIVSVIIDDTEAWASEQLQQIADEMGFGDELAELY